MKTLFLTFFSSLCGLFLLSSSALAAPQSNLQPLPLQSFLNDRTIVLAERGDRRRGGQGMRGGNRGGRDMNRGARQRAVQRNRGAQRNRNVQRQRAVQRNRSVQRQRARQQRRYDRRDARYHRNMRHHRVGHRYERRHLRGTRRHNFRYGYRERFRGHHYAPRYYRGRHYYNNLPAYILFGGLGYGLFWTWASGGHVPSNAVYGNYGYGYPVHICRGYYRGHHYTGRLHEGRGCYIKYRGNRVLLKRYRVLVR